jgi:hypothetical protein
MKIYDLETCKLADEVEGGWTNPFGMVFGSAVIYDTKTDLYTFYGPEDRESVVEDLSGNVVVSFNGIRFDNGVLLGNNWREEPKLWFDYDIKWEITKVWLNVADMEEAEEIHGRPYVHGPVSLNKLCKINTGKGKNDKGTHAPQLIKEEKWKELYQYNLQDVRLTKALLYFMIKNEYVVLGNGKRVDIKVPRYILER